MNIAIPVSFEVPLIQCSKCEMLFVLLAVFRQEDEFGEWKYGYAVQEKTYYCPYCGEQVKGDK